MNEPPPRPSAESWGAVETGDHGGSASSTVSTAVVMAVADAEEVDPVALEDPLHEWVDPDALDAVVESLEQGHVAFEFAGHGIRVDADGSVAVDPG